MLRKRFFHLVIGSMAALFLAAASGAHPAAAEPEATCTSAGSGNWTAITWTGCAGGPQSGDAVIIAAGHTVTLNTSPVTITSLTVSGTLDMNTTNNTNRTMNVSGNVTINTGGTIRLTDPPGANTNIHTLNVGGDFVNNGTFTAIAGTDSTTVIFNGTSPQAISGSSTTAFAALTINSGATVIIPTINIPTVATAYTLTNNGTLQQTRPVNNASVDFLHITDGASTVKYRGVTINTTISGANLGDTTVSVRSLNAGQYCTNTGAGSPHYARRCYEITPTTSGAARVRLYALTTQLNGIAQGNLSVYRNLPDGSGTWVELTTNRFTDSASGGYSYAEGDTPGFSNFLLGQAGLAPTAVTLTTFTTATAMPFTAVMVIFFVLLSLLAMGGWRLAVIRNR